MYDAQLPEPRPRLECKLLLAPYLQVGDMVPELAPCAGGGSTRDGNTGGLISKYASIK